MRSGASTLAYNLFVDAARTGIWGDWGTGAQVRFVAEGTDRTIPIFARIPPQQNPDSGDYADTLVVTVYF
jgi:spore coat protein U-like protein